MSRQFNFIVYLLCKSKSILNTEIFYKKSQPMYQFATNSGKTIVVVNVRTIKITDNN